MNKFTHEIHFVYDCFLVLIPHGYLINTVPAEWISEQGINHKGIARSVLTQKQPIERANDSEVQK